ncbi:uncharacterized protein LOC134229953 [Saccostrea cucullata]|uniref:uncharacterized protein LOC134229953 n=1 Tax=Saccostrea cuccullata TaxID=36930 RepID=UPI002ED21906
MATAQGQDIIRCELCFNSVEHHCNLCHVDLCSTCIPNHMADKSRRHEIVEFLYRKKGPVLPPCLSHKKNHCEMYCQDCKTPTCTQCVTSTHKKHDITEISEVLENLTRQIIADTKELENIIVPKYRNVSPVGSATEYERVLIAIQNQDEKICKAVHIVCNNLKNQVINQKKEAEKKNTENQSVTGKTEREINEVIKQNNYILRSNDATALLDYQSKNHNFRSGPSVTELPCNLNFFPCPVKESNILQIFGSLQNTNTPIKQPEKRKILVKPTILDTIQSPYGRSSTKLFEIHCGEEDTILLSGSHGTFKNIDRTGAILYSFESLHNVIALSMNLQGEPVFSTGWSSTNLYIYKNNTMEILLNLSEWYPRGLTYTAAGQLLVSMRSQDMKESRVMSYSGFTELQKIQYTSQGQPIFSTGREGHLQLTVSRHGEFCVADRNMQAVIGDGNFLCYIDHMSNGGISVDSDHNLVIGDRDSGKIQIIKYLE